VAKSDPAQIVWRKSSASTTSDCVEVAVGQYAVRVRNSRDPSGPALIFSASEWIAFLVGARNGEFDPDRPSQS
jgi:hypothetical protein